LDAADRRELIETLCSFEGRGPGTDAERRAANWLVGQLEAIGRKARVEPVSVHPEYALVIAAHVALALAGSLLTPVVAPLGFVMVLAAATSLYLDQSTRLYLIRNLFFRRASQVVVSAAAEAGSRARLILTAHYDSAKTGLVFGRRAADLVRRLPEPWRLALGPIRIPFWGGIVPLLAVSGARLAGIHGGWLALVQLVPTIVLLVTLALLIDISLSAVVPGAYDNASGVAAAISVAEQLAADPPRNLEVWVVLPGAEECNCEGMARWLSANRGRLDPESTLFLNLEALSYGNVHYLASEGAILSYGLDPRMFEICEAIAIADGEDEGRYGARPARIPFHTDALPANTRGFRAISLIGARDGVGAPHCHTHDDTPDRVDDDALSRAVDFTLELVGQLDRDAGRRRRAEAVV